MNTTKFYLIISLTFFLSSACIANAKIDEPVNVKKEDVKTEVKKTEDLPTPTPVPPAKIVDSKIKPTLVKVKNAQIRLGFGKKTKIIDLDETDDVTLGGESNHRYKLFFTSVKDNKIFFLFQVQSGSPMSDPNAPCGGDSPQTLVWLKTDLDLKVEAAKSEIFASCAYNGGRYQQGKTQLTLNTLKIVFEQQSQKTEISYVNQTPEKGFEEKEL